MINRSILAAIIAIGSFCAAHAAGAADWQTFPGQCNFLAEPKADNRPLTGALPVLDSDPLYVRVHLDEKGAPHIALWTEALSANGYPIGLRAGSLIISVDGHAFAPLHADSVTTARMATSELPPEILAAMHDGQTVRIEYQDGTPETPLVREVSLKGFAGMVDECSALERRYDEQEARVTPDTKADVTLLCDGKTVQVWFNAGLLTWDTAAHRHVWRLDRVGAAEITFKRLRRSGNFGTNTMLNSIQDGPSFSDLNGQIDRVSGAFSLTDGSHGACAPAAAKF
jgi:hypothetical protein